MNLLCPNCQKMLTVPEQYAGQLMKCPLCEGTFTVPSLPAGGAEAPSGTAPPPPSSPPDAGAGSAPGAPPSTAPSNPPASTPPGFSPTPQYEATFSPGVPEPEDQPPPHKPAPEKSPPPSVSKDYRRTFSLWLSPKVLQWIPVASLFFIFILQLPFFSWVGVYYGSYSLVRQSAWGAAIGSFSPDIDESLPFSTDAEDKPDMSLLTLFYLLMFFLVAGPITLICTAVPFVQKMLPAGVQPFLRWRWGVAAAAHLFMFMFLALQLVLGFSLESKVTAQLKAEESEPTRMELAEASLKQSAVQRTVWLHLAVFFHLLAIAVTVILFWIDTRGENRPTPRIDLLW